MLSVKARDKFVIGILFLSYFSMLLSACEIMAVPPSEITRTAPSPTQILPIVTSWSTSAPSLTSPQPISTAPDGLRMAYVIDGNLYFQEGSDLPLQLTHSSENWQPAFSDDGEKIVFLHGKEWNEVHSINVDGSHEQVLITSKILAELDHSYGNSTRPHSLTFVPSSHLLLFATQEFESTGGIWNGDLLVVDTDTAEISKLLPPKQIDRFYVSPNGKFIVIDTFGEIHFMDMRGGIVRRNLLTYTPSEPIFLAPHIHWMPDSTGLTLILPVPTSYDANEPPDYTVWRYTLDGSPGIQIMLDPLPSDHNMARVSPDGNWIIYNSYQRNAFYIGNLLTNHAELYESRHYVQHYDWSWSPDSEYFVYGIPPGNTLYLGSVGRSPALIREGVFQGWIDANRFLYYADKNIVMGDVNGTQQIILSGQESFKNRSTIFTFILPKVPKN